MDETYSFTRPGGTGNPDRSNNMGINVIKKLSDDDMARINAAAVRFAKRHNIRLGNLNDARFEVECATEADIHDRNDPTLSRLWSRCMCRAANIDVRNNAVIGWGHIGTPAD